MLDANRIIPHLWQGSAPLRPSEARQVAKNFDVLVLCAFEVQPSALLYPGVEVVRAGIDDDGKSLPRSDLFTAIDAAELVARRLGEGKRVLVTCRMGHNRSGLVSALALRERTGVDGAFAAWIVRQHRPGALRNTGFVKYLESLPAPRAKRSRRRA